MDYRWVFLVVVTCFIKTSVSLNVSIYYESLCPDSIDFFTQQLGPSYDDLKDYIHLELIPYGKAIHNKINGSWRFQCQHGTQECLGNKQQACALSRGSGQDKNVAFIVCLMSQVNPAKSSNIRYCGQKHGLDWANIHSCSESKEGDELLAKHGEKTYELEPNLSFVPTIVYDNVYSRSAQTNSLYNFVAEVCKLLTGSKPKACDSRSSWW